jgi:hypothetical protein
MWRFIGEKRLALVTNISLIGKREKARKLLVPGYLIYPDGRGVFSIKKGRFLCRKDDKGYSKIDFRPLGKNMIFVHRLVARAFLPNPRGLPFINHKNGKRCDNRLENLEWCSMLWNN